MHPQLPLQSRSLQARARPWHPRVRRWVAARGHLAFVLGFAIPSLHASSPYAMESFEFAAPAGGQSSGGGYTLDGAFTPFDAEPLRVGGMTWQTGFWVAFAALPEEAPPLLRVVLLGTQVELRWPTRSVRFRLEEAASLSPGDWRGVDAIPEVTGADFRLGRALTEGSRFYRLRRPRARGRRSSSACALRQASGGSPSLPDHLS